MTNRHQAALASAIDRAHKAFLRQQQAAKNCIGGEKRRQQLQTSADKAEQFAAKYSDKVLLGSDPDNPLPDATLKIDVTALAEQLRRRATLPADNAPPAIEHKSSDDDT